MITSAVLHLLASLFDLLGAALPVSILDLPTLDDVINHLGMLGAADRFMPLFEGFTFLNMVVRYWMPVALTYTIAKWIYRHLPVIGKG